MQSSGRHCVLKESAGLAGMLRKPPKRVVDLAYDNRPNKCTSGLKRIRRVKKGPTTFFFHLFGERA